jgi:mannose-6-phosphate isomerase-like protein (cupin superfamily)
MAEILTGKAARLDTYEITRRGAGRSINRYPGYKFEALAPMFAQKVMEPLLVTLTPGEKPAAPVRHRGQEFNLVLEGELILYYDDSEHLLKEGDAVYFDPTHPHGQKAAGSSKTRFLTVIIE